MEQYVKRYFWAAILLVIASSAWLVAKTANTFVGSWLEPSPLLGLESTAPSFKPTPVITAAMDKVGHLFGIEPPAIPTVEGDGVNGLGPVAGNDAASGGLADHEKKKNIDYNKAPVKTGEKLQLLAAMVANQKQWSSALIADLEKPENRRYVVGEKIHGFDIYDITREPDRVIIENTAEGRLEYIDDTAGAGAAKNPGPLTDNIGVSKVPPANDDGIKKLGENKYAITKEKLEASLADMNSLATQARIVPSFKDGQADGFKLFSIQPGSVYSALGIQNGDVIQSINGFEMNSPEKALEVYSRLKDSTNFDIVVNRRGQTVTSNYNITGG